MRFVTDLPPIPMIAEEDEPHPLRAIRPVRPVESRTRVPQVVQRFRQKTRSGKPVRNSAFMLQEKRTDHDRRDQCRRLQHGRPFLDTRTDMERRIHKRRDDDIIATLDEEV